jgi:SlyX protein
MTDTRLTEMESRLAHHERMTEDVSAVLTEQGRAIDALTLQLRRLTERIAELEAGAASAPPDDQPPPHY